MLLVILGAGASFDAIDLSQTRTGVRFVRPPLAAQLFDLRDDFLSVLRQIPSAQTVASRLRRRALTGGAVERAIAEFVQRAATSGDTLYTSDIIALRFYLQEAIRGATQEIPSMVGGGTNYLELVDRLYDYAADRHDRVVFVTFNYDLLLEGALTSRFGLKFKTMDDYLRSPMQVYKPHGSLNWAQSYRLRPSSGARVMGVPEDGPYYMVPPTVDVGRRVDLSTAGPISFIDDQRARLGTGQEIFVPALAVPADDKDSFVMPPGHLDALRDQLSQVDELLVVGWRATETAFLELLASQLSSSNISRSAIVDFTPAEPSSAGAEAISNLTPILGSCPVMTFARGFSGFMGEEMYKHYPVS